MHKSNICLNFPQEILEHMLTFRDVHDNLQRDIRIWDCNLPEHLTGKCVALEGRRPCWLLFSVVALLCLGGEPTDETPPCSFSRVRSKLPLTQKCCGQADRPVLPNISDCTKKQHVAMKPRLFVDRVHHSACYSTSSTWCEIYVPSIDIHGKIL